MTATVVEFRLGSPSHTCDPLYTIVGLAMCKTWTWTSSCGLPRTVWMVLTWDSLSVFLFPSFLLAFCSPSFFVQAKNCGTTIWLLFSDEECMNKVRSSSISDTVKAMQNAESRQARLERRNEGQMEALQEVSLLNKIPFPSFQIPTIFIASEPLNCSPWIVSIHLQS